MNVVVIGASSSIGRAVVQAFTAAGHRVTDRRVDLTDATAIREFAASLDGVDALVMLAGVLPGKPLAGYGDSEIERVMQVNCIGPMRLVREVLPRMRDGSHVLLMSSIAAARGSFDPVYAASKAALEGFMRSMARGPSRVRFNAVAPGLTAGSSMYEAFDAATVRQHIEQTPTGRLTTLDEIAQVIVDVCGPAWANVNGHVFAVDGGRGLS